MNFLTLLGLRSKSADTRSETVESLADTQDPAVLPSLYPLLRDEDVGVRKTVVKAIASFRDFESVPRLCEALRDKDPSVRVAVLSALIKVNDRTSMPSVIPLLQDSDPGVQKKALSVLEHFRWSPANTEQKVHSLIADGRLAEAALLGAEAIEPLSSLLESSSEDVRLSGIEVISTIPDSRVWKFIGQGLKDESPKVRIAAIEALRRVKDIRIFELLVHALHDSEERVRRVAAELLGYQGQRSVDALLEALRDASPEVRSTAAESLGRIADPRAIEALGALVEDAEIAVRGAAVSALGAIRDPGAVPFLMLVLNDEDWEVRRKASSALHDIDPAWSHSSQAEGMLQELGTDGPISLANEKISMPGELSETSSLSLQMVDSVPETISHDDEDATIKPLITELQNTDPTVRFKAAKDLGRTGNPGACPALERALDDDVPPVRRAAAEALAILPWQPSNPSLIAVQGIILQKWEDVIRLGSPAIEPLIKALSHFDSLSQKNAAMALGEIRDSRATEALLTALDSVDMGVRRAAVEALAKIGDARAVEGLIRAKSDPLKPVRDAVESALQQLGVSDS